MATRPDSAWLTPHRLMATSIAVAVLTLGFKTLAWWLTGSVGLLSDALESLVNVAGATFGLWMVTVAARPADEDHPFGHDKAEYFSSGFEGILIIVAALAIVWAALPRFWHPQPLQQLGPGLALSVLSAVLNGALGWIMLRASRRHRSMALEGDARHLITDVWTSAGVVLGLLLVMATGWHWVDPAVAIVMALNILYEGGQLIWRSTQGLMDAAVEPEVQAQVDAVVGRFVQAQAATPGLRVDHAMSRRAGQRLFLSVHLHLPADWSLRRAAALGGELERALLAALPQLHVSVQLLPLDTEPAGVPAVAEEDACTP
ncbi:MAG: cation transporter [Proteobacteria bacterium]|uniref:cation diffusion facilitator family transporter n=1 Tax=Ottowia sp. TaxID=1898956 RepID=UPI001D267CEC|nr:cation diffusion facilitator family transporter [Ottowia sp.]MBS0401545.1 cation transporter [Pseudomonadota bacterium]MBS0413900.1 cation transporter [Pseudomonadota bacterium]